MRGGVEGICRGGVGWVDKLFNWKKVFFGRQITQEVAARNFYL